MERDMYNSGFSPLLLTQDAVLAFFRSRGFQISGTHLMLSNKETEFDISLHLALLSSECGVELLGEMKTYEWPSPIRTLFTNKSRICITLDRPIVFAETLKALFKYCTQSSQVNLKLNQKKVLSLVYNRQNDLEDFTNYRVALLVETVKNLSRFVGYDLLEDLSSKGLYFANESNLQLPPGCDKKVVLVGSVLNAAQKNKKMDILVHEYRSFKEKVLLKKMEGRNTMNPETASLLTSAVLNFSLIRNKISRPILLDVGESHGGSTDAVIFILYNYSRLNAILYEYESRVSEKLYPDLPLIEEVDFSVLKEKVEWTLLFRFISQFSFVIKSTVKNVEQGLVAPHLLCQFLHSLARVVSSYYRSTKILLEAQPHLLKLIFARIYLIKGVHLVLQKGLIMLNIEVLPAL